MDIMHDILAMVRYYRNSNGWVLEIPTTKDIANYFRINNIRAPVPYPEDPFWSDFSVRLNSFLPVWRAQGNARPPSPPTSENPPPRNARPPSPPTDEAIIRSAKGSTLQELLTTLSLHVDPHPSNPGITAMRQKNTLLAFVRHGGSLSVPAKHSATGNTRPSMGEDPSRAAERNPSPRNTRPSMGEGAPPAPRRGKWAVSD